MFDTQKHGNDVSSGEKVEYDCDECERKFTTKQGRSRHKTMTHTRKENLKKEEVMKRNRSVQEKSNSSNFKCDECAYSSKSKWALKAHVNHKHKEPTSPNEKKPRIGAEVVENILSEVVQCVAMEIESGSKSKTTIEPTKDFLTNTAATLAEMLDNIADQIDHNPDEEDDDDMTKIEDRLYILRGDEPRNKKVIGADDAENTLITLPLKDVEELRLKLRNLEEINEELAYAVKGVEELKIEFKLLQETNRELLNKAKESEDRKGSKKNKEPTREEFIVIDMETNDENDGIEQLLMNKNNGFSRFNPQSEAQMKRESQSFHCPDCKIKISKRDYMTTHQKTHNIDCSICDKSFKTNSKLQEHIRNEHDTQSRSYEEMICHIQCGDGRCTRGEAGSQQGQNIHTCNLCDETFVSRNMLSTHKTDVHRTYKPCRDMVNCVFQSGCYFSHVPVTLGKVRCFQCGEEFNTKNTMMIHRKIHGEVKDCIDLIKNQCSRGESCWWNHNIKEQVFRQVKENLPPPIQNSHVMHQEISQQEIQMSQQHQTM